MLKLGLIGSGYLIEKHIEMLQNHSNIKLVGYFDTHKNKSSSLSNTFCNYQKHSADELLENVDAIYVFNLPEQIRFALLLKSVRLTKHLLVDKSNLKTVSEAKQLQGLSEEAGTIVQVCNSAYFSPLFKSAQQYINYPSYIETITQVHYKNKSANAIFDLLCDDLSIILTTVNANIKKISTVGVDVIDVLPELINIILEFDNGSVANITINTIAEEDKKTIRFFENNSSILLDFLDSKISLLQHNKTNNLAHSKEIPILKTSEFTQEILEFFTDFFGQKSVVSDLHLKHKVLEIISKIAEKLKINFALQQD